MSTEEVVVVTGGAGFFGSNLVRLLQEKSPAKQIRVLDLNPYVPLHGKIYVCNRGWSAL